MAEERLISEETVGCRLDAFVSDMMEISRTQAQLWIDKQQRRKCNKGRHGKLRILPFVDFR